MQSSAKKNDKLASVFMITFLLMGSTHFACRYDMGTAIEAFFNKASAETLSPTNSSAPANNSNAEQIIADGGIISKSITRNPFQMPVSAIPHILPVATSSKTYSTPYKATAPAKSAEPLLHGIISKGDKSFAIIEYKGISNYYSSGQKIGDYTVSNISTKTVSLYDSGEMLELNLEGANK